MLVARLLQLLCTLIAVLAMLPVAATKAEAPLTADASARAIPLSQRDLGATVLALIANAQFAISRRDAVAATNDISAAQSFARQLQDRPSLLIAAGPRPETGAVPPAAHRVTAFEVLVRLNSAQSDLANISFGHAAAELRALRRGTPHSRLLTTLPLLSAAASLDSARSAVITGRAEDLLTQLLTAQHALNQYGTSAHSAAARTMAHRLRRLLTHVPSRSPDLSYQLGEWSSQICGWMGAERWGAVFK